MATEEIRHVSHEVYKRWMKRTLEARRLLTWFREGATWVECMLWDYDYPVVLGQRIFCLRANPSILYPRYLYAYMTSASFQSEIVGRATGTSVDSLRQTEVLELKIALPPLDRTKSHAEVLWGAGRQDRVEPADERDAGGDGAGAVPELVRGFRPRPRQTRRPPAPRPRRSHRRPLPRQPSKTLPSAPSRRGGRSSRYLILTTVIHEGTPHLRRGKPLARRWRNSNQLRACERDRRSWLYSTSRN